LLSPTPSTHGPEKHAQDIGNLADLRYNRGMTLPCAPPYQHGKILVLDLDDTLLCTDKTVTGAARAALLRWQNAGHTVVVATGRPPRSVAPVLPPELTNAIRIVYNGARIVADGCTVFRNEIAPDDVRTILHWAATYAPHWCVGLEIDDELFLNREMSKAGHYTVADLWVKSDRPAAKVLFLFPDGRDDLTPLLAMLPPSTRALISPKFSLVQVCGGQTNKATALYYLLQQWERRFADVIAIGDDVNDVELVAQAGIGIAMANGVPELLAVADWVTAANDADGVALAIDRLLAS
jgi:Cof subfamily protein (haloacid dehalogenase superfamily)